MSGKRNQILGRKGKDTGVSTPLRQALQLQQDKPHSSPAAGCMPSAKQQQSMPMQSKSQQHCLQHIRNGTKQQLCARMTALPVDFNYSCHYPSRDYVLTPASPPTTKLLQRYMERQMELGGNMNTLYGIDFYGGCKLCRPYPSIDAESELIQLRLLLKPYVGGAPQQQLQEEQLALHVERLLELSAEQLVEQLEHSYLSGLLDAAQLQQLQQLLPLQQLDRESRQRLINFYRRLAAELPHYRFDMNLPQHVALLQRFLMLSESTPHLKSAPLLAATIEHMGQLQLHNLYEFLDQLNPAQLLRLMQHLKSCHTQLATTRQIQRLLHVIQTLIGIKPLLRLEYWDAKFFLQMLNAPLDEPLTMQERRFLQSLLDHLLPLAPHDQLSWLQALNLNSWRVQRFRLMLHNPALLYDSHQLRQFYGNLDRLSQHLNQPT